jgi:hypothetical protein
MLFLNLGRASDMTPFRLFDAFDGAKGLLHMFISRIKRMSYAISV